MTKVKSFKGITLIALVITIIILLILAGISISALTNQGLFEKAKDAKKKSENAEKEQSQTLSEYETALDQFDEKTLAYKVNNENIKVGEYVKYTPDDVTDTSGILKLLSEYSGYTDRNTQDTLSQEKDLNWRILDIVDGKVRLISDKPTNSTIALKGWNGYNNAVYLIDDVCKTLYSNKSYANSVQNLKIEDIQNVMLKDYTKLEYSNYGETSSPKSKNYPSIFAQEEGQEVDGKIGALGLSKQDKLIKQTTVNTAKSWNVKCTYWYCELKAEDYKKPIYRNLFIEDENKNHYEGYWLSSRCIMVDESIDSTGFKIRYIPKWGDGPDGQELANGSSEWENVVEGRSYKFRPVITLNSNVQVKSGKGTQESPYEIGI